jgi:WD40 repeat protein
LDNRTKPHRLLLVIWSIFIVVPACLSLLNYAQQHYPGLTATKPVASLEGVIEIGILESETLRIYNIRPVKGSINLNSEVHVPFGSNLPGSPLPLGAHLDGCAREADDPVFSPDGRFYASCSRTSVVVRDASTNAQVKTIAIEKDAGVWVNGIAWSPDSKAVVLLKNSERWGYGPLDLFLGFSGHPVPYNSVGFVAVSVAENEGSGLPYIGREFRSAWSYIRWRN